jgi:hypothetical protein
MQSNIYSGGCSGFGCGFDTTQTQNLSTQFSAVDLGLGSSGSIEFKFPAIPTCCIYVLILGLEQNGRGL